MAESEQSSGEAESENSVEVGRVIETGRGGKERVTVGETGTYFRNWTGHFASQWERRELNWLSKQRQGELWKLISNSCYLIELTD